jgi:translocation and assembly module TamA
VSFPKNLNPPNEYDTDFPTVWFSATTRSKGKKLSNKVFFAVFAILLGVQSAQAQAPQGESIELCPGFTIIGDIRPGLTGTEERLICGDPKTDSWRTIPYIQKKYSLKNFLQQRGFLHPLFKPPSQLNPHVTVLVGWQTLVTDIKVDHAQEVIQVDRKRDIIGRPLTPALLSSIENWVTSQLKAAGYGCPSVRAIADAATGEIIVQVKSGTRQNTVEIVTEPIPNMESSALRRYDAFGLGEKFNSELLTVTTNRIIQIGMVESSHFTSTCDDAGVHVRQEIIAGPPRLLSIGIGLDTEGFFRTRVSWRNTRLGRMGSLLEFIGIGSSRIQTLRSSVNWYFLPYVSRYYLSPVIQFTHRNEQNYEYLNTRLQFGLATTTDHGNLGASFFLGPTGDLDRTLRGPSFGNSILTSLEGTANFRSHSFEFYATNPRSGFTGNLIVDLNDRNLLSDFTAQRFYFRGEALWNYKDYDPPLWIFGIRGGLATLITAESVGENSTLPARLLQYLGGSADLRGFGRQELPGLSGALTSVFLGTEARLSNEVAYGIDPFIFVDAGGLGLKSMELNSPLYWSPGVGIRWRSPAGPIRTTIAHGFSNSVPNHFQFYFSFGEEF